MTASDYQELTRWIISSDRRLMTLKFFKYTNFARASEISIETGRSIQNISTALKELKSESLVEQLDPESKAWKKYALTQKGKTVLNLIEREMSTGMFERLVDELSYRHVKDAFRLIVNDPIAITKETKLYEAVDRILADPRTRTAYVIDDQRRVIGMIRLKKMLSVVEESLASMDNKKSQNRGRSSQSYTVARYMVKPMTVNQDDMLLNALRRMIKSDLEDLPVVDENGVLVGELNGLEILMLGSELMKSQRDEK